MAITFPIAGVTASYEATRDISFTLGTAPLEDDIIVAFVSVTSSTLLTAGGPGLAGWTNVLGQDVRVVSSDSALMGAMLYHRVTEAEATANTVTWTLEVLLNSARSGRISVGVMRGVRPGDIVGTATDSNSNLVDGNIPTVTPTANSTVIAGFAQDGVGTRDSAPTGYTDIAGDSGIGTVQHAYIYRRTADGVNGVPTGDAAANTTTNDEFVSIVAAFSASGSPPSGSGRVSITSTAQGGGPPKALGTISITSVATGGVSTPPPPTASGTISISGTAVGSSPPTASGIISISGTATVPPPVGPLTALGPSFGGFGTIAGTSTTATLGTAPQENDIIVAFLSYNGNGVINDPAGWTNALGPNVMVLPSDLSMAAAVLWRRVTPAEAALSQTSWALTNFSPTAKVGAVTMAVLRGGGATSGVVAFADAKNPSAVTNWTIPSVMTSINNALVIAGIAGDGTQTQTLPAGHTLQASDSSVQSNYLYADNDLTVANVGTGVTTATASGADEFVAIAVAFVPEIAPPPPTASGAISIVGTASDLANADSITFPIAGVAASFISTSSPSFTLGTAPQENDIIVAILGADGSAATTDVAGWTNVLGANVITQPGDNTIFVAMAYHRVSSAEANAATTSWTLTSFWNAAETGSIAVAVMRGALTTGELVGTGVISNSSGGNSAWFIPSLTPTSNKAQIVAGVVGRYGLTQTTPAGHAVRSFDTTAPLSTYLYSRDEPGTFDTLIDAVSVVPSGSSEYVSIAAAFTSEVYVSPPPTATGSISIVGPAIDSGPSKLRYGAIVVDKVHIGAEIVSAIYYGEVRVF